MFFRVSCTDSNFDNSFHKHREEYIDSLNAIEAAIEFILGIAGDYMIFFDSNIDSNRVLSSLTDSDILDSIQGDPTLDKLNAVKKFEIRRIFLSTGYGYGSDYCFANLMVIPSLNVPTRVSSQTARNFCAIRFNEIMVNASRIPTYTVVGLYTDTLRKFVKHVKAENPAIAINLTIKDHPQLVIAAVFSGEQISLDKANRDTL